MSRRQDLVVDSVPLSTWKKLRTAAAITLTAALAVSGALVFPATAQAAPGDPFDQTEPLVMIAQDVPTQLKRAQTTGDGTFEFVDEGSPTEDLVYNAIGFNVNDGYFYGAVVGGSVYPAGSVIRIGQEGDIERVEDLVMTDSNGAVINAYTGAFGDDGLFYLAVGTTSTEMIAVDVAQGTIVNRIPLTDTVGGFDMVFSQGYFWAVTSGIMSRIDPVTGVVTKFPSVIDVTETGDVNFGGSWLFGNGNLGFSANTTGTIYQISVDDAASANPNFTVFPGVPGPPSGNNDGASIPGLPADLEIAKTGPASFQPGGQIEYTITVTNNGEGVSSGWTVRDTLPEGLSNPVVEGATSSYDEETRILSISGGRLPVGDEATITVTADAAASVEGCLVNTAEVIGNEEDPNADNNVDEHEACAAGELEIAKTSDAGQDARVGDTVNYEVQVTNTGATAFTADNPAQFSDDLSGVLDDATWNDDATVSFSGDSEGDAPVLDGTNLTWSGPLGAGETATFTYSVTLTNAGDGQVLNSACVPEELAGESEACASTETLLPKLGISKAADTTELPENGGTVNYTITVTNNGPGAATADNPASITDDLSEVLDDADFDDASLTASSGEVTRDGDELVWTGPLGVDESATITYSVVYDSTRGDQQLDNVVCLPVEMAQDPNNPCRTVQIPGSGLSQWKSSDPASGSTVVPGQEITYTLHFANTGQAAARVDTSDDLSNVLDDATVTAAPAAGAGDLVASDIDGDGVFTITGDVPVGETATIVYTVQVNAFADQGDSVLGNVLADPTGSCLPDQCETAHRVPHLSVSKDSTPEAVNIGDTVNYTITLTNDGQVDYSDTNPASWSDDLAGVLDDATWNDDAAASSGEVTLDGSNLSWSGPLAVGDEVTVTYSVTVTSSGDNVLENTVCTPANGTDDAECDTTTTNLPYVVADKVSDPANGENVNAGDVVTYTLSWTNTGQAAGIVDSTDDLTEVLDDATVTSEPVSSSDAVTVTRTDGTLRVVGPIAAGETVTVTYQVTVNPDGERGDNRLENVLVPDVPCLEDGCAPPPVVHPVGELVTWKSVDPATNTTVREGDELTYTLHFENTGNGPVAVDREDVVSGVLDDADITSGPTASADSLSVSEIADGRFSITGELAAGANETVTYTVQVKATEDRGDDRLANFLVPNGEEPPEVCEPVEGQLPNCTVNPVSDIQVSKSSDPESGTEVAPGDDVTYTLTFTNRSQNPDAAAADVDYTDHMVDVLDDADLTAGPTASDASLTATLTGDQIRIVGAVASGETVTVTYTVTVKDYADQGNGELGNVVAQTGDAPVCVPGSDLCTEHPAEDPPGGGNTPGEPGGKLPVTGGELSWMIAGLAALLLTAGGALMIRRKKGLINQ